MVRKTIKTSYNGSVIIHQITIDLLALSINHAYIVKSNDTRVVVYLFIY